MANNLIVSYDLIDQKDYAAVIRAIKSLGSWSKPLLSVWYVNSAKTAKQARDIVSAATDNDDKLLVVDASNNEAAWINIDDDVSEHLKNNWYK